MAKRRKFLDALDKFNETVENDPAMPGLEQLEFDATRHTRSTEIITRLDRIESKVDANTERLARIENQIGDLLSAMIPKSEPMIEIISDRGSYGSQADQQESDDEQDETEPTRIQPIDPKEIGKETKTKTDTTYNIKEFTGSEK